MGRVEKAMGARRASARYLGTAEDDDDDEDEKDFRDDDKGGKKTLGTGLMSPEPPRNSTCPQGAES
jgi:hypothetical protein